MVLFGSLCNELLLRGHATAARRASRDGLQRRHRQRERLLQHHQQRWCSNGVPRFRACGRTAQRAVDVRIRPELLARNARDAQICVGVRGRAHTRTHTHTQLASSQDGGRRALVQFRRAARAGASLAPRLSCPVQSGGSAPHIGYSACACALQPTCSSSSTLGPPRLLRFRVTCTASASAQWQNSHAALVVEDDHDTYTFEPRETCKVRQLQHLAYARWHATHAPRLAPAPWACAGRQGRGP